MNLDTALLAKQPFLKGLSERHLEALVANALLVDFPAGKMIFTEGLPANRFYIVLEGEVALESSTKKSGARLVQTIKQGDVLGWSWLFPPYQWHFDARAVKPTRAIIFFASNLRALSENDYQLGYELLKRVSKVVIKRLQATRIQSLKAK